jgi:hypothetical protein
MASDNRIAYKTGQASNRYFFGGVFNFLESFASSKSSSAATTANAS